MSTERTWLPEEDDPRDGAHESLEVAVPDDAEVDRVWRDYWKPLLRQDEEGAIARLKGELYDAWFLVNQAREVYRHVTGGLTDDLTASAEGIIALAEKKVAERTLPLRLRIRELEAELREARKR